MQVTDLPHFYYVVDLFKDFKIILVLILMCEEKRCIFEERNFSIELVTTSSVSILWNITLPEDKWSFFLLV